MPDTGGESGGGSNSGPGGGPTGTSSIKVPTTDTETTEQSTSGTKQTKK